MSGDPAPRSDAPLGIPSPAGRVALQAAAAAGGRLYRWPGGFWYTDPPPPWHGHATVERLIEAGQLRVVAQSASGTAEVVEVVVAEPLPDLP